MTNFSNDYESPRFSEMLDIDPKGCVVCSGSRMICGSCKIDIDKAERPKSCPDKACGVIFTHMIVGLSARRIEPEDQWLSTVSESVVRQLSMRGLSGLSEKKLQELSIIDFLDS